jgi:hypothetical protein
MTRRAAFLFLFLAPLAWLGGCAEDGPFPSLAQRPAEREYARELTTVPAAPAPLPDDPAVAERVAGFAADARRGASEFEAAYAAAAAAAARAGGPGSDSWAEAQQAVSRAAAAQATTTRALADLDRFALDRAHDTALSAADSERLRAATTELQALVDGQAERVNRLETSLRAS